MLRNPLHILSALLCLGLLAVLPAVAAPQADPDQEIDLSLRDADLVNVLESFAAIAGGSLDAEPGLDGVVTIELNAVPWRLALDRLCRLNDLSCYWSELDGPELVVRSSDGGFRGSGHSLSMGLRDADLQQTLMAMSAMAGDDFSIEVDPALSGSVSIDLRSTPWPVALEELCRNGGCAVTWGVKSAHVGPLTPEAKALRTARHRPAELWVDPALTRDRPDLGHRIEALRASSVRQPVAAFDELCESAGCTWALHWGPTPRLKFVPKPPADPEKAQLPRVSTLPIFGVAPVAIQVALDDADGEIASRDLQFDWGHPTRRIGFDTDQGKAWLTLTWLPFSPTRQLLLPSVVHCDGDGVAQRVSVFDPVTLPLDQPWGELEGDVGLSLRSLAADLDPVPAGKDEKDVRPACLDTEIRLIFELTNLDDGKSSETEAPGTKPGNYLMIRPPAAQDSDRSPSDPLAALVYVASSAAGDVMARVSPGDDDTPPEVEKISVSGDWTIQLPLAAPDQPPFSVEVTTGRYRLD